MHAWPERGAQRRRRRPYLPRFAIGRYSRKPSGAGSVWVGVTSPVPVGVAPSVAPGVTVVVAPAVADGTGVPDPVGIAKVVETMHQRRAHTDPNDPAGQMVQRSWSDHDLVDAQRGSRSQQTAKILWTRHIHQS